MLIVSTLYSNTEFIFHSVKFLQYTFIAFTQWIEQQYQGYAVCGSLSAILETRVKSVSIMNIVLKASSDMSSVYSGNE